MFRYIHIESSDITFGVGMNGNALLPGPYFIVFEGIDGSGKGTQARLLIEELLNNDNIQKSDIFFTREPSESKFGDFIRDELRVENTDPQILALLFAADRAKHVQREIIPKLQQKKIVISERYVYSSFAYQGVDVNPTWIADINYLAIVPDIVFILDIPTKIAQERINARNGADTFNLLNVTSNKKEFFEKKWLFLNSANEILQEIYHGNLDISCSKSYKKTISFSDAKFYNLDATKSITEIQSSVKEIVYQLFKGQINRICDKYNYNLLRNTQKTLYDFFSSDYININTKKDEKYKTKTMNLFNFS